LELDSSTFLNWVALQGGAKHEPGVRDELSASTMSAALEKLNPEAAAEMFTETPEAVLAEIERKDGEAWYSNTASFIIDRFGEKPSASAANCEYVLVMVLDDVGDPAKAPKLPPLAPTWIMETSPGSFQWGYAFSEQPTKADFAAAIKAIAAAGYTDPGACNPVRNYRLPGSVNLKPGKNGFKAKLIEFNPTALKPS